MADDLLVLAAGVSASGAWLLAFPMLAVAAFGTFVLWRWG